MPGTLTLHFVLSRIQCVMLRRQFRVIGQCQLAPVFKPLRLQRLNIEMRHQRIKLIHLQRLTEHRLQLTQGNVLVVLRLDLLCHGHAQACLGFQHIGARAFATFEQALIELQALGKGPLLRPAQFNALLRQQRLAVGTQYPHQQVLAFTAKTLIGKQCLRRTLSQAGIRFVVQQRLLQGQSRSVAAVIAVCTGAGLGHFRVVTRVGVVPRQRRQQRGTTESAVLLPCRPFLDRGLKGRIVMHSQVVRLQ